MGGHTRIRTTGVQDFGDGLPRSRRIGFTLVEMLVVVGIISVLIGILLPALKRAQEQANAVSCASNLHQLGIILQMYSNDNDGWLYPVGPPIDGKPTTLGTNLPPNQRWPMRVAAFDMTPPDVLPFDPAAYAAAYSANALAAASDEKDFPAAPFTPTILKCPADPDAAAAHTYVLNKHLVDKKIKVNTRDFGGLTSSQVIVVGEKLAAKVDYYLEANEFKDLADQYKHGPKWGSNYLYHDGHVGTVMPDEASGELDPWDVKLPEATSKPST